MGAALLIDSYNGGKAILRNCTFVGNTSDRTQGAVISNFGPGADNVVEIDDSVFWGNSGPDQIIYEHTYFGAIVTVQYCQLQQAYSGPGNVVGDPLFVNASLGDYRLSASSPAKDTGSNALGSTLPTDLLGNARIVNTTIDRGAYEYAPGAATLKDAKLSPDGAPADITGAIVTRTGAGIFYAEAPDRSIGIRVSYAGTAPAEGDQVSISGFLSTTSEGERVIQASQVVTTGAALIKSLHVQTDSLGGQSWSYNSSNGSGQQGVTGATGLNNIGLLMTVTGRVTAVPDASAFYLDDGCSLNDGSGFSGVRVSLEGAGITPPALGSDVTVTGISSCYLTEGVENRRVLLYKASDVILNSPPAQ